MKTKRIISLLVVLVMSLGIFTGCGDKKVSSGEKATLTVGIPQNPNTTSYDDNALTNWLEEQANVELEFVYFSSKTEEVKQQIALMCSANETLPDVILTVDFGYRLAKQYGEDGYFIDLSDYIEKDAPNYQAAFESLDKDTKQYIEGIVKSVNDGAYYSMPKVGAEQMDDLQSIIYINQNWLTKLNLPVPSTIEELRTTLQAFKDQDPNGNGVPDEIPMLGKTAVINYLINAFVLYDYSDFNVTDGKVWDAVTTDEYRQALIYANQLVKDGLYDKMSFSISSNSEYKTLISPTDGPSKVGIFVGHHETMTNAETNALEEFIALPALSDVTGKGGYTVVAPRTVEWSGVVTKDCKEPEAAMRLLDLFYTDEAASFQRHGEKGVDWEYEEGKNAYGTDSYVKITNSEAYFSGNSTWCGRLALGIYNHWNYIAIAQEGEGRVAEASRLQEEQWNLREEGKQPKEYVSRLVYSMEEYDLREEKESTIESYIDTETNYFVAGEKDPSNDATWNEFLKTLKSIGREELMDICQSAYDRQ